VSNEEDEFRKIPPSIVMKKLFKLDLNTIPRPLLIRLSYVASVGSCIKGDYLHGSIDGKSFKKLLPYSLELKENVSALSLERHRLLWLYLNEKLILQREEVLHFAPEQTFTNCSETRKT
jgi:hypothetical protein